MLRNEIVLVDIFDNEIGITTKDDAHKTPKLHRAFSVFLVNDENEILIQKRAITKYHSGGLWANACCSHPKSKEDVILSAVERLKDELDVEAELKELFNFIYMNKFNDNLYEYELDHVLIGKYNGEIKLNEEEASEYRWISLDDLSNELVAFPEKYSSWFKICAPKVIKILKNNTTI